MEMTFRFAQATSLYFAIFLVSLFRWASYLIPVTKFRKWFYFNTSFRLLVWVERCMGL